MKAFISQERFWQSYALAVLAVCALALGVWARFYHLGFPPFKMWDEIYFSDQAVKYLQGRPFFDLHPPLGKFILAIGPAIFGDTPVGWRIMPAVFGCALIALGFFTSLYLLKDRTAALLAAILIACETMFVIYSRTGIMDGILVFFVLATFFAALLAGERKQVIWVVVLLGLTISIKWAALMVAVPAGYILWRKGLFKPFFGGLYVSLVIYLAIVYFGQIVNPTGGGREFVEASGLDAIWNRWVLVWEWHHQALNNLTNATKNTEASPWWSWPLMMRPMLFRTLADPEGNSLVFLAIGNPLIWWSSTIAVLAGFVDLLRRRLLAKESIADHPLVPILLGYVALILPWIPGTRIPYIYNYFPSYVFALMALVYWLALLWRRSWGTWIVVSFVFLAIAVALFFLPVVIALPISQESLQNRIWLDSWQHPELQ